MMIMIVIVFFNIMILILTMIITMVIVVMLIFMVSNIIARGPQARLAPYRCAGQIARTQVSDSQAR